MYKEVTNQFLRGKNDSKKWIKYMSRQVREEERESIDRREMFNLTNNKGITTRTIMKIISHSLYCKSLQIRVGKNNGEMGTLIYG